ncbi:MAG: cytochrome c3 family protein [Opitutaceae bacterium]|nr:cytochrome c3 family protein [Opitutaceae bacterium]
MASDLIALLLPPRMHIAGWAGRLLLGGACLAAAGVLRATQIVPNSECLDCHEAEPLPKSQGGPEKFTGVRPEFFQKSVHGKLNCVDCHAGITETPHPSKLPPAQCATCHEAQSRTYAASIHGVSHTMGASGAATCASCHGTHEMVPVKQLDSPVFKLNLPQTCATCHSNRGLTEEYRIPNPEAPAHYRDSIHGRALLQMGLIIAPSCNNCHGVHDIKRSVDKDSHTNHAHVAGTCGQCHLGIEQVYNQSVHGQLLAQGDRRGPVCSDCHSAHEIEKPASAHFKSLSDRRCGRCHEDRLAHYRETYHGKAMALGRPNVAADVAACYDCHGHHDVFPVSDPRSRLSQERIVGTCQQCHAGVGVKFTTYQPHANPLDKANYPLLNKVFLFMTALLVGVFAFFGVHTLFWLVRSVYLFLHDSKAFREAKVQVHADDEQFTRFTPFERFLHLMVVTSFLLLVITGMPLKFYYTDWARTIFNLIGGADVARSLHHFGALVTFAYFGLHVGELAGTLWRRRQSLRDPATGRLKLRRAWTAVFGPDSMVPSFQDWRDFIAHQKWFFGKGPRPQFDRWTYWERFDYFAVFWGIFAIGVSGLIMWFPKFFTLFLPGWIINIALVVHSDEALLAAGFIFTFHFFNTHFRIEKFPMDTVIFSGRISKTELLHERKRWHDRLVAEGRLEEYRVKDDWEGRKKIAKGFGFLFFGTGLVLLALIVYAMLSRLLH